MRIMRIIDGGVVCSELDANLSNLWPPLTLSLAQLHLAADHHHPLLFCQHQKSSKIIRRSDQNWTIAEENGIAVGGGFAFSLDLQLFR